MEKIARKKNDLLVVADGGFIFCDSRMVARKFEVQHAKVIRTIELVISRNNEIKGDLKAPLNNEFAPNFIRYESEYRKQKFTAYRMNRTAFSLIAMRFETPAAFRWQVLFAQAFLKLETEYHRVLMIARHNHQDAQWVEKRESGKPFRRIGTDMIKKFVEYSFERGSSNAGRYYGNITRMSNKTIFDIQQRVSNLRDVCNAEQLVTLQMVDTVVARTLEADMAAGVPYKQIYQNVKNRVQQFADLFGKTEIPGTLQIGM